VHVLNVVVAAFSQNYTDFYHGEEPERQRSAGKSRLAEETTQKLLKKESVPASGLGKMEDTKLFVLSLSFSAFSICFFDILGCC